MNAEEIIKPVIFHTNILVSNKTAEAIVNVLSGPNQLELFKTTKSFKSINIKSLELFGFKDCHEYFNYHFDIEGTFMTSKDFDRLRKSCIDKCYEIFSVIGD